MTGSSGALLVAAVGATGVHLVWSSVVGGRRSFGNEVSRRARRRIRRALAVAGANHPRPRELVTVGALLAVVAGAAGHAVYGGWLASGVVGLAAGTAPMLAARSRQRLRLERARDAWPRMIEEIRIQVIGLGRSVPQALLDVGRRGPEEMRPAFGAAERTWMVSTDFSRTLDVLRTELADPTADAVCETLLIAHELGGTDADGRLRALVDDRIQDVQGRRDARARQSGVRFARVFVLVVPAGMALVGLAIGDGRAAYATAGGQAAVLTAFAMIAGCWWWAGRLLRLPDEPRVFVAGDGSTP
ncbi:MAG: hypothetical protein WDZ26_03885 [Nitriliruptoraceae bacterium]